MDRAGQGKRKPAGYISDDIFVLVPTKQTLKAWTPFWDCVTVYFEIITTDLDEGHQNWRLCWITGMTLLRTVGHVLVKVDAQTSAHHKREIEKLWAEWKSMPEDNAIFWDFVEKERNNILKTYTFGAELASNGDDYSVAYANGENAFSLFSEALYWWRHQLMGLEERL